MRVHRGGVLAVVGMLVGAMAWPAAAADKGPACPTELAQARAMVARAQDVIKAGKQGNTQLARTPTNDPASGPGVAPVHFPGTGVGGGRTPQGDPTSVAGRTPLLDQGTGTARGLATSAAEISPWTPSPTDKTLQARTRTARKLTTQAAKSCAAGKLDESKAKALEAIGVLNPK